MFPIIVEGILLAAMVLVLLIAWNWSGWRPVPSVCGHLAARADLARGHFKVLAYGMPIPWNFEYWQILEERYGVEGRYVAGCIVSEPLEDYVAAYNKVSVAAINGKFGRDVFTEANQEAMKDWEQENERQIED